MKQQLNGVKPVQMSELEAEFEKVSSDGKPKPERLLKSQQQTFGGMIGEEANDDQKGDDEEDDTPDYDPFESMEAVDILGRLPKNFYELGTFSYKMHGNAISENFWGLISI